MKNELLKKIVPHAVAVVIFLVVAVLFCKPVLDGNVLNQHDTIGWKGAAQNAFEYKEKNGHFPLWNPNVFSGMPNYQIAMHGKGIMPDFIKIFTLGLPKPINFFFLACICFYILCLCLRLKPLVGMVAGLAFAFSTYNAVVINAGHDTQMIATALVPLMLAGLVSTYQKNYWLGLSLTTFGAYHLIAANHLQITYYAFIIALIITIGFLVDWILKQDWKHIMIAGGITLVAAVLAIAGNALILKTTSEYAKFTMRGGKDVSIEGDSISTAKTKGLDTTYAFEYSLGKAETFTLMMPNAFGGASNKTLDEKSNVVDKLTEKGVGESNAIQFATGLPKYWGSLPYTAGPAYLGVMICILGLIGFILVKTPLRWGLLAATLFGILISWGKNFAGFNVFLFENLPIYNKFRAPSMAQVIPQITIGIMSALALHQVLYQPNSREILKKEFKKVLIAVGALFGILALMYLMLSYTSPLDDYLKQSVAQATQNNFEIIDTVMSGLKADRKAMFGGQFLRAAGFAILLLGALFLYIRGALKAAVVAIGILVITTLEITVTSKAYLSDEDYVSPEEYSGVNFTPTAIDNEILKDKDPNYRVLNMAANTFAETKTSYFHKSVGGYHPAKLRIYQDIIEKYLSGRPSPGVVNMLNTKYIIVQDPGSGQPSLIPNPDAFGPVWLVKHVQVVDDRVASLKSIGQVNLKDTVIIEKSIAKNITQPQWDSTASIRMTKFDNDVMEYEVNAAGPQYAVFSEIYYPKGWNAYLDGKQVDYQNVNYLLRGMPVPAGKHTIRFVFEPQSFKQGVSIMYASSFVILLVFLGGLFMAWRDSRKKAA